jgi:hypothetical protein
MVVLSSLCGSLPSGGYPNYQGVHQTGASPSQASLSRQGRQVIFSETGVYRAEVVPSTLNGQIRAEAKPTEIDDYDSDGIPDSMVKFNRSEGQKILQAGEEVRITVGGNLTEGRLFEGTDFIRVKP